MKAHPKVGSAEGSALQHGGEGIGGETTRRLCGLCGNYYPILS